MDKMNSLKISLAWALISIPISWCGIEFSYALAHGALPVLVPLIAPGLIVAFNMVDDQGSELTFKIVFYVAQYISYAVIIFIGILLKNKFRKAAKREK
ncbi:hypothetical protein [Hahella sp. CCB-MM4]|uniref:hypothetical protein n=1 Tax=Hahella sp. (strain CCB-MM4) TaxID=1926491 RepID=UPI000B9C1DB8|nr:hypothetical protein [Hahella sp. CCB-MM4]